MAVEIAPRITVSPSVGSGKPVIKGTRIPVALVVGQVAGGLTVEEVAREYGSTPEDVRAALRYAADSLADVRRRDAEPVEIAPGITASSAVSFGKPVVKGTRIPVALVLGKVAGGISAHELEQEYDLDSDEVRAAVGYAASVLASDETLVAE